MVRRSNEGVVRGSGASATHSNVVARVMDCRDTSPQDTGIESRQQMQQWLLDPCSLPSAPASTVFGRLDVLAAATCGAPHYFFSQIDDKLSRLPGRLAVSVHRKTPPRARQGIHIALIKFRSNSRSLGEHTHSLLSVHQLVMEGPMGGRTARCDRAGGSVAVRFNWRNHHHERAMCRTFRHSFQKLLALLLSHHYFRPPMAFEQSIRFGPSNPLHPHAHFFRCRRCAGLPLISSRDRAPAADDLA